MVSSAPWSLRGGLLAASLLLAVGCGGEDPEPTASPGTTTAPGATTAPERKTPPPAQQGATQQRPRRGPVTQGDPSKPQLAFQDRSLGPPAAVQAYLAEWDALDHGWLSEVYQEQARAVLGELLQDVVNGALPAVWPRLGEEFVTTTLRPEGLREVYEDQGTVVRRPEALAADSLRGEPAQAAFAALHSLFQGSDEARVEVEIVSSNVVDKESFTTEALIVLSCVRADGRTQVSTTWRNTWQSSRSKAPLLSSVEVLAYEEVTTPGPFFADLTGHVFGGHRFFGREFMLGVDDYYYKLDQLAGSAFIGSQGIAVGDANGDGVDDVFVAQQGGLPNRLFVQTPDGRAQDISGQTQVGFLDPIRGALFVDLDNDGDQDMALALGPNVLVVYNNGSGHFEQPVVLEGSGRNNVFSLCAADPDEDGDLDIYTCHYILSGGRVSTLPAPYYDANNGSRNHYWRNDGRGKFTDATEEVGLNVNNERFSLAAVWEDFDRDGDVDLYVTNDFGRNNLYRNDDGHFTDIAEEAGASDMAAGMGATVADYDRDGDMDVYVSNMFMAEGMRIVPHTDRFREGMDPETHPSYMRISRGNTLLSNRGDGTFEDVTLEAGVARGGWAWGAMFTDLNNDGWSDIYVPNGFVTGWNEEDVDSFHWRSVTARAPNGGEVTAEYSHSWAALENKVMQHGASWAGMERNRVYLNTKDGRFSDVGAASGADFLEDARAAAMVDWDDDGRLDMVMKNRTAPRLRLLLNQSRGQGNFLAVELRGTSCNRDAIGARVEVELPNVTLMRTLFAGEGYIAQSSKRLHFGLGASDEVRSLTVHWPGGESERHEGIEVNTRYRVVQGADAPELIPRRQVPDLAAKATAPLSKPQGASVDRVVLVERIPLGPMRVPSYKNPDRTVADFDGFHVLFDVWATHGVDCHKEFARIQRRSQQLEDAGIFVVAMSVDPASKEEEARKVLAQYGLDGLAGVLDDRSQLPFELLLTEILGRSRDAPLPTSFLVDKHGRLAVIYLGPVRIPQLMQDVALLDQAPYEHLSGEALLGAQWLSPRMREMERLVNAFGMLGLRDLGRHFFEFEKAR